MRIFRELAQQEPVGEVMSERLKGTVTRILNQSLQDFKTGFLAPKPAAPRASMFGTTSGKSPTPRENLKYDRFTKFHFLSPVCHCSQVLFSCLQ